jgi:hypothetical protein
MSGEFHVGDGFDSASRNDGTGWNPGMIGLRTSQNFIDIDTSIS